MSLENKVRAELACTGDSSTNANLLLEAAQASIATGNRPQQTTLATALSTAARWQILVCCLQFQCFNEQP
jgi:hypothetical protein